MKGKETGADNGKQEATDDLRVFSTQEAAERLGYISPSTVVAHIRERNLKPTRLGRRVFISAAEIRRVIEQGGLPNLKNLSKKQIESNAT